MIKGIEISNSYLRGRMRAFEHMYEQAEDDQARGWLRNSAEVYKAEERDELAKMYAKSENNSPLSFVEQCSFSTFFALHPEKVSAEEQLSTSIHFPVKMKGTVRQVMDTIKNSLKSPAQSGKAKASARLQLKMKMLKLKLKLQQL